ncbi:MAG: lysylphosphatidylglycerol synthase transmembrane domain-containing protein [Flavobacteriaceae bacterium]|nr:lysylphosphatidylglycerol synthase transmembrane domain-containing protein [Flavobacteriaceae bacterium]
MKKVLSLSKKIIPLAIGVFFIYLSYQNTTPEDRANIFKYIKNADYRFVLLSAFFGVLSHISRAVRWQFLLAPLGYRPKTINSVLAVLIGYFSNLGIPRSGELLRATAMDRYENIPFQKGFGTVIAERVVDLILLVGCIVLALALQYDLIVDYLKIENMNFLQMGVGFVLVVIGLILFRKYFLLSTHPLIEKIKQFFQGIWEGMLSIKLMENKGLFIAHTFLIWLMYVLMFWVIKFSIPETVNLGINAMIPAFVVGGLSISATNGGVGIYPYSVSLVLIAFGISKESSLAFGWIMWTCQTLMIVTFGAMAFFALPLINSKK